MHTKENWFLFSASWCSYCMCIVVVNLEESNAVLTFDDWLSSVTERINQTMHYQFSGEYR